MAYIIAGLGNPGGEYTHTRHNTGRLVVEYLREKNACSEWKEEKKLKALFSEGEIAGERVKLLEPDNFMNNSGKSLAPLITNKKKAQQLIVIYDDLDLPFGTFKIAFDRGSGGHKGIESIARSTKTKGFVRIRVGISPVTPAGKPRKPKGEEKVVAFIMKNFKPEEIQTIKKLSKEIGEAVAIIIAEGHLIAMNKFN